MGRITDYIAKREKKQEELENEAIALQDELQNLVPPSLSQWMEKDLGNWTIWGDLTFDGSASVVFVDPLYHSLGFESRSDAEKKFKELDEAWKNLVKVTIRDEGERLKVCFTAL